MNITPEILKNRTFNFALSTLKTVNHLKNSTANEIMGKQVMRSANFVGANYRAVCKAKSTTDFINKLKIVEEESEESVNWLELIKEFNKIDNPDYEILLKESSELEKIFAASAIRAKNNKYKSLQW
ncbi:MAG: four helix bundle protein [Bacteroidetes bacterium]|nr:four helix bundle protein [Bacteroidota bacterium]